MREEKITRGAHDRVCECGIPEWNFLLSTLGSAVMRQPHDQAAGLARVGYLLAALGGTFAGALTLHEREIH